MLTAQQAFEIAIDSKFDNIMTEVLEYIEECANEGEFETSFEFEDGQLPHPKG